MGGGQRQKLARPITELRSYQVTCRMCYVVMERLLSFPFGFLAPALKLRSRNTSLPLQRAGETWAQGDQTEGSADAISPASISCSVGDPERSTPGLLPAVRILTISLR
jgi:hypothetical protein